MERIRNFNAAAKNANKAKAFAAFIWNKRMGFLEAREF